MEHFRERTEILSLVLLACAHMRLRAWVHNCNCMEPLAGEQMGQPRVVTCSDLDIT
jgi:hypothetical protein